MDISVVILTWNSEKYIDSCLSSLFSEFNSGGYSHEIIIVDNGSRDQTVQLLSSIKNQYPKNVFPVLLDKNMGTTYPRNLALKMAKGDVIIIMDSDVEVSSGSIENLFNFIKQNKDVGIVAPRLFYPSGNLQKSTDDFPTLVNKINRYLFLKKIEEREGAKTPDSNIRDVDYAISAMWVLRNELVEKVGLLDEKIFYAPEDVDYCYRVWKSGLKVTYNQGVSCIHHTQEISRGLKINSAKIQHVLGLIYYFRKHRYLIKKPERIGL
jgi:GT2 family glycosyltransferase